MTAYVFALIVLVVYPLALSVWAGWCSGWRGLGTPARDLVRERREHEERETGREPSDALLLDGAGETKERPEAGLYRNDGSLRGY